jgi:hypothetical protein
MIRKSIYTLSFLCFGSLLASQAAAQSDARPVQQQLPPDQLMTEVLSADLNEEFVLMGGDDRPGELAHRPIGKDDEVTCGFCGTNDDDEELPFNPGKMNWEGNVQIYPNPATDQFSIRSGGYLLSVELLAIDGRLIRTIEPTSEAISIDDLAPGLYLVRMDNGARIITQKLVVQ